VPQSDARRRARRQGCDGRDGDRTCELAGLAFVAALGSGLENAIIAIALTAWPPIARLARAETLTVRRADYIAVVRLAGASDLRIIVRHIMPICIPSVIIRILR
jgi:peptide/nickel transport system permease protein